MITLHVQIPAFCLGLILILTGFLLSKWSLSLLLRSIIEKFRVTNDTTCDDYMIVIMQIFFFNFCVVVLIFGIYKLFFSFM